MHAVVLATQVLDAGCDTTEYEVLAVPPLLVGGLQRPVMTPFVSAAVTRRGAVATFVGETWIRKSDLVASRQEPVGHQLRSSITPLFSGDGVSGVVFPGAVDLEVALGDSFKANAQLLDHTS